MTDPKAEKKFRTVADLKKQGFLKDSGSIADNAMIGIGSASGDPDTLALETKDYAMIKSVGIYFN